MWKCTSLYQSEFFPFFDENLGQILAWKLKNFVFLMNCSTCALNYTPVSSQKLETIHFLYLYFSLFTYSFQSPLKWINLLDPKNYIPIKKKKKKRTRIKYQNSLSPLIILCLLLSLYSQHPEITMHTIHHLLSSQFTPNWILSPSLPDFIFLLKSTVTYILLAVIKTFLSAYYQSSWNTYCIAGFSFWDIMLFWLPPYISESP